MEAYKFKKILFDDGFLNNSVDATYIIHLEGNGRYHAIFDQLKKFHPTNIVYILFNKGYKKSIKKSFINSSMIDLVDANFEIFKHAKDKNYNNILILEDDFYFSEKINEKFHQNNINYIINELKNKEFMYFLGCIPVVLIPFNLFNFRLIGGATHAVIFSKKYRNKILDYNQEKIKDWDRFNNNIFNKYTYYIPLCYQLFEETENQKNWGNGGIFNKIISIVAIFVNRLLKLNTQFEPGFTITYIFARLSIIIFLILFIFLNKLFKNMGLI